MYDIFISYARSTAAQAQQIAEALRALGYGVWRDDQLPVHRDYSAVIEEHLRAAKAVVVVWSAEAVKSRWVCAEADVAHEAGTLVQLSLDGSVPPLPFNRIQCADMDGWAGDLVAPGWRKIASSIAELTGAADRPPAPIAAGPLPLPSWPSIAVLPFANLSTDPEQEYFADGMVEEIVAALSRFRTIFVIGSGSSLALKGKGLSPKAAAVALGVRYVLEGSVRKGGDKIRVTVKLTDAVTGAQIWNETFQETLDDVFALQDAVTLKVSGTIQPALESAEVHRASRRLTDDVGGYDLYLRALPLFRTFTKENMFRAIELLDHAIALDPDFAIAMALAATCHAQVVLNAWSDDPKPHQRRIRELGARALAQSHDDAMVLAQLASAYASGLDERFNQALALSDRAIGLNSGSSFVWMISGYLRVRSGEPDVAIEHLQTAIRLDPLSLFGVLAGRVRAFAMFEQGRFSEALAVIEKVTDPWSGGTVAIVAALYGHLGMLKEARAALEEYRGQSSRQTGEWAKSWFRRSEDRKLFSEGIALAEGKSADAADV